MVWWASVLRMSAARDAANEVEEARFSAGEPVEDPDIAGRGWLLRGIEANFFLFFCRIKKKKGIDANWRGDLPLIDHMVMNP
jgi:hypothetical protein